jgi:hypothetical protein
VSENIVLHKIFGPKKYEVSENFRIISKEELRDLNRQPGVAAAKCLRI